MRPAALLLALVSCLSPLAAQASPTALYSVRFEASWSALSHPLQFPLGPHFSGLVGANHDGSVGFWAAGDLASPGIEQMAELGVKTLLIDEVAAAGSAATLLSGGGIGVSPGTVSMNLGVSLERPLVTLVSMLAPSPDWFVGVAGLSLLEGGDWLPCVAVDLFAWDAGTDDGVSYQSSNADSQPQQPIALLGSPLTPGVPVGRFVFTRSDVPPVDPWVDLGFGLAGSGPTPALAALGNLCAGAPLTIELSGAPATTTAYLCVGTSTLMLPFHGGVLVPDITPPTGFFLPLPTDGGGALTLATSWPLGLGAGLPVLIQAWTPDAGAPLGFSASNALSGETP